MRWTVLGAVGRAEQLPQAGSRTQRDRVARAMSGYVAPAQNRLVADQSGQHRDSLNRALIRFVPAMDAATWCAMARNRRATGWDICPSSKYPQAMNPAQGFLASANQQPVDPRVNPSFMGRMVLAVARDADQRAAARRFGGHAGCDAPLPDRSWKRARRRVRPPVSCRGCARGQRRPRSMRHFERPRALLAEWDRHYTKDNKRAVLFEIAMEELATAHGTSCVPQRGESKRGQALTLPESQVLLELMQTPNSPWWDDTRTPNVDRDAGCNHRGKSARGAHQRAEEARRPVGDGWLWSNVRHANIYHLAQIPALSALDIPVQGGPVDVESLRRIGKEGASWRMVVELGPEVRAWATYPGGQSGNPASPRYKDRLALWQKGELAPVLFPRTRAELDPKRVISILDSDPR